MKPISTDGSAASPFMRRSAWRDCPPSTSIDGARMHTRTGRLRFPSPCAVTAVFVLESMARPVIDCGSLRSVDTCGHHGLYTAWTSEAHRQMSYTHLRAHETPEHLVCRLLLEKKKNHSKY